MGGGDQTSVFHAARIAGVSLGIKLVSSGSNLPPFQQVITRPVIRDGKFMEVPLLRGRGEIGGDSAPRRFVRSSRLPRQVGESVLLSLSWNGMPVPSSTCISSRILRHELYAIRANVYRAARFVISASRSAEGEAPQPIPAAAKSRERKNAAERETRISRGRLHFSYRARTYSCTLRPILCRELCDRLQNKSCFLQQPRACIITRAFFPRLPFLPLSMAEFSNAAREK